MRSMICRHGKEYTFVRLNEKAMLASLDRQKECHVYVVLKEQLLTKDEKREIAELVMELHCEWIQACGTDAQALENAVDDASIATGNFRLTTCDADLIEEAGVVEQLLTVDLSGMQWKLVLVAGGTQEVEKLMQELHRWNGK